MNRRDFTKCFTMAAAAVLLPNHIVRAVPHKYRLAPETMLPEVLKAPLMRFAKPTGSQSPTGMFFRYIPCYCGCGEQGHTGNASCYVKDNSPLDKPEFDSMSVG